MIDTGKQRKAGVRPDGVPKVSGDLKYLTDYAFSGMLYGKIKRSDYPHAAISHISTEKAEKMLGVRAVITYKDIPVVNGFGIVTPDQPVLCKDKVRYVGDAVAAVAADSIEEAEAALKYIDVTYEPLPVLDTLEKSLAPDALLLHPEGNILHRNSHKKGKGEDGLESCFCIVEETYHVPRQMHTYMETEGGVIVPDDDGGISVFMGTQHGFKDRFQLSRILGIEEELIRVVSTPIGGSFGGKDELNVQPYAALLALKCGAPVKIHQTRNESVRSSIKRHPMTIKMKTGCDEKGSLLAHKVEITADTGAYSTLGPAILDFAVEHAAGPYIIPHIDVEGKSVFTNNGVAGEFRGFGGNQVTFALEGQMDRLAEKIHISPLELRKKNLRKEQDPGPLGQTIAPTNGAAEVLDAIAVSRSELPPTNRWKHRGRGSALTMHGGGLGTGRLDPAGGRLSLTREGRIAASFGFEEFGQGIVGVIEAVVTETLGCSRKDVFINIGDTTKVPPTGSTTASRGTSMVWHALQRMKGEFLEKMADAASRMAGLPKAEFSLGIGGMYAGGERMLTLKEMASRLDEDIVTATSFDFPKTPDDIDGSHYLYSFAAVLADVEVDIRTGRVAVTGLKQAVSAGPVINERGYKGQIEGGGVMSIGYTLMEEAVMEEGRYITENLDTYLIPGIADVPFDLEVEPIETLSENDPHGPRGVGEIGTVAVAPAIIKAIHEATGLWFTHLPISSDEMLERLSEVQPWILR